MKRQLSRISILQSSKIVTALAVLLVTLYSSFDLPTILSGSEPLYGVVVNCILKPALMAVIGFIGFVIFAVFYNLLASVLGGIEYEVNEVPEN